MLPFAAVGLLALSTLRLTIPILAFCPPGCKCNEVKLSVFCNNSQIDLVPIMLNPQLMELNLSGNRVKHIYSSFSVYHDLRFLDISHNLISDIGRGSFNMQKKLRILVLRGNNITQVDNQSFNGLDSLQSLDLSSNQMSEVSSRVFMRLNQLEHLDLAYNFITSISKEAFFGLLNLKQLSLHSNKLKVIPAQSFYFLQSLITLNLGHNLFTHVSELSFASMRALQELRLDSCHINAISARAFAHLHNLTRLDLQNNKLFTVPSDSLSHLTNLRVLDLSRNLIVALKANSFRNLTNLHTLVISFSPLGQIDRDAFHDNPGLTRLVMEGNRRLQRIVSGTFAHQADSLHYLSLRANSITSIDWQAINLNRLQYLNLQENPLVCNCSISWLTAYLQSSNLSLSHKEQVQCYYPSKMSGKKLITLSESDLSCPKLNWTLDTLVNSATYVGLLCLVLMVPLVFCWRRVWKRRTPTSVSTVVGSLTSNDSHQRVMAGGLEEVPNGARLDEHHCLYYHAPIIDEELARDKHYHSVLTSSTLSRPSALISVDLHPLPHRYVPIAHI